MELGVFVLAAAAACLALGAAAAFFWLRRRRWLARVRRACGRVGPRHPVVLLHGLFGFDELALGPARVAYFRGLTGTLDRLGADVHRLRVARTGRISLRARQLARRIEELDAKRVNLIAHSMGGLDARYAIAKLGMSERVASLVTIGTPHRGTPLADLGARALGLIGIEQGAFRDLTTTRMAAFNRKVRDVRGVWYGSVVAHASGLALHPLLWPGQRYLAASDGPNDGVVPLASQAWGEVVLELEADHWAQIGWSLHFDAATFFEELLRELRGRGF